MVWPYASVKDDVCAVCYAVRNYIHFISAANHKHRFKYIAGSQHLKGQCAAKCENASSASHPPVTHRPFQIDPMSLETVKEKGKSRQS